MEARQTIHVFLAGLGNVNLGVLRILIDKHEELEARYGLTFQIAALADSRGVAFQKDGWSFADILEKKESGRHVNTFEGYREGVSTEEVTGLFNLDLVLDGTPANLKTGFPGLQLAQNALRDHTAVVLANKAPLVLDFEGLMGLSKTHQTPLKYSATVCGGLPVINMLQRDMIGAEFLNFQGILNATTNFMLDAMVSGMTYRDALAEAKRVGAAETDPTLDVEGFDAASKLLIIMKTFTGYPGDLSSIKREGITKIDSNRLRQARSDGHVIKLVAIARKVNGEVSLTVAPEAIPANSFLGQCKGWEMGIVLQTDLYDSISMKKYEEEPVATSAAVLRDAINIFKKQ